MLGTEGAASTLDQRSSSAEGINSTSVSTLLHTVGSRVQGEIEKEALEALQTREATVRKQASVLSETYS